MNQKKKQLQNYKVDELQVVEQEGIVTSPSVCKKTGKNMAATIRRLNSFARFDMIQIIETDRGGMRKFYIKNEMYKDICREEE